jgi:hypothetical protein
MRRQQPRRAVYAEILIQSAANCQDVRKLAFYIRARLTGFQTLTHALHAIEHCPQRRSSVVFRCADRANHVRSSIPRYRLAVFTP